MTPQEVIASVEAIVSPVYLVGGSVRDMLLGRTPKDYDFCTPLSPDEVEQKIEAAGRRTYSIGKEHGTIGFRIPRPPLKALPVEITTFRIEFYAPGSRKPEKVEFTKDLTQDLSRRDFTFNAIALKDGEYIDPFGGRLEILAKKIKAVGEATDRFKEDPLRMLRAARFASQLGFEVDPNMIGKIRKMPQTILGISRERWVQEMDKLLLGDSPEAGLKVLTDTYLLKYILPEVWNVYTDKGWLWDNLIRELNEAPKDADIRWGVLLKDIAKPIISPNVVPRGGIYSHDNLIAVDMASGICGRERLKFSRERTATIKNLVLKGRY